jgi:hypothetical protein
LLSAESQVRGIAGTCANNINFAHQKLSEDLKTCQ